MTDYGHELEFGYFLIPDANDPRGVLETPRLADRLGYDLLAVQDHPYQPAHLDTFALLGAILAQTERVRVFQDVGNLPLRRPATFAKAAATLDLLSGGRFEAGLGGGGFLQAAHAMGAPALTPGESLEALEEAIVILRACWSTAGVLRFHGRHYQLDGARPGPKPAHEIGIWLGAAKPRALAFTPAAPEPARDTDRSIVGPPDHWAEMLAHLALDLGFGTFILLAPPEPDTLRTFIEEVAPEVRQRVEAARLQAGPPGNLATL